MLEEDVSYTSSVGATDESIRRMAQDIVVRGQDADDLAQELWLKTLAKPGIRDRTSWLRVVARRMRWQWLNRERARSQREKRAARSGVQANVLAEIEAASLREFLHARVAALEEPYRSVLLLHYFEELSIEEVGARLGRPGSTVRVQLQRGLECLRNRLEGRRGNLLNLVPLLFRRRTGSSEARGRRWIAGAGTAAVLAAVLVISVDRRPASAVAGNVTLAALTADRELPGPSPELPQRQALAALPTVSLEEESGPARLHGRVLTSDGRPLAGAPIFLRDSRGSLHPVAVSAEDGRYQVAEAEPSAWIEARPESAPASPRHLVVSVPEELELDLVSPRPTGHVRGHVWSADGAPVRRAKVSLNAEFPLLQASDGTVAAVPEDLCVRLSFGQLGTIEWSPTATDVLTDASGAFEVEKPPGKRLLLQVHGAGLPTALEVLETVSGEDQDRDVQLAEPAILEGRLTDPGGIPCAGARLELVFPEPYPACKARTDASGRYRFDGLASGPFVLRMLERQGPRTASCRVRGRISTGEHQTLDLTNAEAHTIRGSLEQDGRPLAGWTVVLREVEKMTSPRRALTGSDGSFLFLGCRPECDLELLYSDPETPAASYSAITRTDRSPVLLQADPSGRVRVRGHVVRRDNAPRPTQVSFIPILGRWTGQEVQASISPTGVFTPPLLAPGEYYVNVFFQGAPNTWRTKVALDEPEEELELEIPEPGSLRVDLALPAGTSFEDASALVRLPGPFKTNWVQALMSRDPEQAAFTTRLMPGTYRVSVRLVGYATCYLNAEIDAGQETRLSAVPKRGFSVKVQITAPRPLGERETLHLRVEDSDQPWTARLLQPEPGENTKWWTALDLTVDARRLVATACDKTTEEGLTGELVLSEELLRSGEVLRVELQEKTRSGR